MANVSAIPSAVAASGVTAFLVVGVLIGVGCKKTPAKTPSPVMVAPAATQPASSAPILYGARSLYVAATGDGPSELQQGKVWGESACVKILVKETELKDDGHGKMIGMVIGEIPWDRRPFDRGEPHTVIGKARIPIQPASDLPRFQALKAGDLITIEGTLMKEQTNPEVVVSVDTKHVLFIKHPQTQP